MQMAMLSGKKSEASWNFDPLGRGSHRLPPHVICSCNADCYTHVFKHLSLLWFAFSLSFIENPVESTFAHLASCSKVLSFMLSMSA